MDRGLASLNGYPSRFIVSLDLQKRRVELMVALLHRIEGRPERGLPPALRLAVVERLLGLPVLSRRAFYQPQELPFLFGCHHLRQCGARHGPHLTLQAGRARPHARERSTQMHGHCLKSPLPEQTAHIGIPLSRHVSVSHATSTR